MNKYLKTGIVFISFFIYPIFMFLPFHLFGTTIKILPDNMKSLYLVAFNTIFLGSLLIVYNKDMIRYYHDFKKNGKKYISSNIRYWYLGLFIMIVSNLAINPFTPGDLAENEQYVRQLIGSVPLYMLFSTVIYAPLVEELICRKALRDIIPNKWIFITLSALIFGGAHVIGTLSSLWNLLYIIPYGALGGVFAYVFYKTDNLFTSIFLHALHNGILISLYFIIL